MAYREVPFNPAATGLALTLGGLAATLLPRAYTFDPLLLLAAMLLFGCAPRWRLFASALLGLAWVGWAIDAGVAARLPADAPIRAAIVGTVADVPEPAAPIGCRFLLDKVETDGHAIRGLIDVSDYSGGCPRLGQRLALSARLKRPRGLLNFVGFDSEQHALRLNLVARASGERLVVAEPAGLAAVRGRLLERLAPLAAWQPAAVKALALGDRSGLSDAQWELLARSGLTHLFAISGFHISMLFVWMLGLGTLARRVGVPLPIALSAIGGWLLAATYGVLTGYTVPTQRTLFALALVTVALAWRRQAVSLHTLGWAAMLVLAADPLAVLDRGYWLSFTAVAALLIALGLREGLGGWRAALWAQPVCFIALYPLLVGQGLVASGWSLLINLVAVPLISLIIVPALVLALALLDLLPVVAQWLVGGADLLLDALLTGTDRLLGPVAMIEPRPPPTLIALLLAGLGAVVLLIVEGWRWRLMALLLLLPALLPRADILPSDVLELQLLDVGQGSSLLIRSDRSAVLIDLGPGHDATHRQLLKSLTALAVARLDALIISHGDSDHRGQIDAFVSRVRVDRIYSSAPALHPRAERCTTGQHWFHRGFSIDVLHPNAGLPYLRNDSSCVLRIASAYGVVLVPGDIGDAIEDRLLLTARAALRADVVVVPHHGSASSSGYAFINATRADLALVSAGADNRFGHPKPEIVERWQLYGAQVLNTAEQGGLRVRLTEDGLQVASARQTRPARWREQ